VTSTLKLHQSMKRATICIQHAHFWIQFLNTCNSHVEKFFDTLPNKQKIVIFFKLCNFSCTALENKNNHRVYAHYLNCRSWKLVINMFGSSQYATIVDYGQSILTHYIDNSLLYHAIEGSTVIQINRFIPAIFLCLFKSGLGFPMSYVAVPLLRLVS
jgi:hypothetical protein